MSKPDYAPTLTAPLLWSAKEAPDGSIELWVDGTESGPGALLARLTFDPNWGPPARQANSEMIIRSVNGHVALVQAILLVARGIRNKNIKDQSIIDLGASALSPSVETESLSEILRKALDRAGYRLEFKR